MAVLGIQSANGQCIKNGATCKSDGSIGNCCSGYCYQIAGASSGVCQ
nr:unnamed protein product [Callosobruchus chinensis]CAH7765401.1 unnamed protein product [Callosobruchus chinensis]